VFSICGYLCILATNYKNIYKQLFVFQKYFFYIILEMAPSLLYQVVLYFNGYYFCMYYIIQIIICILKTYKLPYPTRTAAVEWLIVALLYPVQRSRMTLGGKGNLTDKAPPIVISSILNISTILGTIHLIRWQTYVIYLEMIFGYIELIIELICFVLGFIHLLTQKSNMY